MAPRTFLIRPDAIFLFFSLTVGLALCFLIPPLGGGNEVYNFQRAAGIAYGYPLVEKAQVPAGIARFIDSGNGFFRESLQPPFSFPRALYDKMAAIPLDKATPVTVLPSPIAMHHPFCYAPEVIALWLGRLFNASPLITLYLARLAGLFTSTALIFLAIRRMPSHRYLVAALALLPPITFSRSCIETDPVANGLAFFYIATLLREITRSGPLRAREIFFIALFSFVMAQCKSLYFPLLLLTLAIPKSRFPSTLPRPASLALFLLPGIIGTLAWMLSVKHSLLAGAAFHDWGGDVNPDAQMAFILHHPLGYIAIFLRTLFLTPFFPEGLRDMLGVFGPPVSLAPPAYLFLIAALFAVLVSDTTGADMRYASLLRWISALIVASFLGFSLTTLYLNWTGVAQPIILGFQGRYWYPLIPLIIVFARPPDKPLPVSPAVALTALAAGGLSLMLWTFRATYYG